MDKVEEFYWKIKSADEATISKTIDRAIKEGYEKELNQAVTRVIVNLNSRIDVFELELNRTERELMLEEIKNKKLHKVINKMHEVMQDAPGEDDE